MLTVYAGSASFATHPISAFSVTLFQHVSVFTCKVTWREQWDNWVLVPCQTLLDYRGIVTAAHVRLYQLYIVQWTSKGSICYPSLLSLATSID